MSNNILVTGGLGFIGSHTVVELINRGYNVDIIDNLTNSNIECLRRIKKIVNIEDITHYNTDINDIQQMRKIFSNKQFDAVIHFAAYKSVNESIENPLKYYNNNVCGTITLLQVMEEYGCKTIVFSSSATVYGSAELPYHENKQVGIGITNPYGKTKYMIEEILRDVSNTKKGWKISILRYFNPVGAHPSGEIGEDPSNIPNNLMPILMQVCTKKRKELNIYGNDYPTPDSTCRRDYVHVVDLAKGHICAVEALFKFKLNDTINTNENYFDIFNLGSGKPTSVMELLTTMKNIVPHDIPYKFVDRMPGDLAEYWADVSKAKNILNWETTKTVHDICNDTWTWIVKNPNGYSN